MRAPLLPLLFCLSTSLAGVLHGAVEARNHPTVNSTSHWAYLPVRMIRPPAVQNGAWPRTDIDRFIMAGLEAQRIAPAPDAEAATLCRRLYFNLIGLPPTSDELEAFVSSALRAPESTREQLVDRLLGSPRFGEHWARHWFDVVRFGESVTLRGFIFKDAWRYRDYMIDSFNQDIPFDQVIREHVAGDLLPYANVEQRRRQLAATTFLAMGNWNLEEQDKKQLDMDVVDEQLDTIGKAFLGQTVGCARCHDHKFDPIPMRDYYAMAGILRNARTLKHANVSEWLEVPWPVEPEQERTLQAHEALIADLETQIKLAKAEAQRRTGLAAASNTPESDIINPITLPGVIVDSAQAKLVGQWQHSQYSKRYIGDGYWHDQNEGKGEKTLTFAPEKLPAGRYELRFAFVPAANRTDAVPITVFHADGETTLRVNEQETPPLDGRFVVLGQFRFEGNGFGYVLVSTEGTRGHVVADAVQFLPVDQIHPPPRSVPAQVTEARPDLKTLEANLKKLKESGPKRPHVMSVREEGKFEDAPLHMRGNVHQLGERVPRGFLTVATHGASRTIPEGASGRSELADWIVDGTNPLTGRVLANRVWLWMLGEGLVRSPDNFGTTGEPATHPELLDYLAGRLMQEQWSIKRLIRQIALSRVYGLSSQHSPTSTDEPADPQNRFLARAFARRLTAEELRDAMLFVSGELRLRGGGPTYPADRAADFGFVFNEPLRSVYVPVFRNALPEIFTAFNFAPPSMVTGRREASTVPTQALFLLNHPFVRDQAQAAARQWLAATDVKDDADRIKRIYQSVLGRMPTPRESAMARRHLDKASGPESVMEEAWTELIHALLASADFRQLD